jgi:hypothetical protein
LVRAAEQLQFAVQRTRSMLYYQVLVKTKQWQRRAKIRALREWPARTRSRRYNTLSSTRSAVGRDFLKKRARYLRIVAQNNKADGANVTPIIVVASIDPELLTNLVIELSRRDNPEWHMRLAVDHVHCRPKTLFLVLFCELFLLHRRWVLRYL